MSRRLFWQLNISLLVVSLLIFSGLHSLAAEITIGMTELDKADQKLLLELGERAEVDVQAGHRDELLALTREIDVHFGSWSAVVLSDNTVISSRPIPDHLNINLGFQRLVEWPVHSFMQNVLIGMPFQDKSATFVIELPQAMYPKVNTSLVHGVLTIVLPSFLMTFFCWIAYRYLIKPLEALNQGALRLASGDLSARVLPDIPNTRRDELTQVASSFDSMADRIERLVNSQRQLIGDLSHELRTPLTRIGLALEICKEDAESAKELLPRLQREVGQMHSLVEDSLTLAWLDGDPKIVREDQFNLATLLDLIKEDAEFEYPGCVITSEYDANLPVSHCSQQALSQTIENILRNALKYSPIGAPIDLQCRSINGEYEVMVSDCGPGVQESELSKIFEPFYRTDKARTREVGGFGLGLALCKRQVLALGGSIKANNRPGGGLDVSIRLPTA